MSTLGVTVEATGSFARLRSLTGLPMRGLEAFIAWRRHREGIRLLLELDDRLLRDAGFIREQIERLR